MYAIMICILYACMLAIMYETPARKDKDSNPYNYWKNNFPPAKPWACFGPIHTYIYTYFIPTHTHTHTHTHTRAVLLPPA